MLDAVVPSHSTHTAENSSPAPQKVGLRLQGLQSSPRQPSCTFCSAREDFQHHPAMGTVLGRLMVALLPAILPHHCSPKVHGDEPCPTETQQSWDGRDCGDQQVSLRLHARCQYPAVPSPDLAAAMSMCPRSNGSP